MFQLAKKAEQFVGGFQVCLGFREEIDWILQGIEGKAEGTQLFSE